MVTSRNRAQLILIGALLLATVIFGLSFLLNSLLFSSSTGAAPTGVAVTETTDLEFEIQRGVRSLGIRVNHDSRNRTAGEVAADFEDNVTRFSRLLSESKAASESTVVRVEYENASSTVGSRIVQTEDAEFTADDNSADWTPVPASPSVTVGWFTANVKLQNLSGTNTFDVTATNASDQIKFELSKGINSSNLSIDVDGPGGTKSVKCGATNGRVLLDLYGGTAYGTSCSFPGLRTLTGPMSIGFADAGVIEGRYAIVVNRSTSQPATLYDVCSTGGTPAKEPCAAPVIWSANVSTSVLGDGIEYSNAYNMTLYRD